MAKKTAPQPGTSDMPTTTNDSETQRKEFVNPTEAEENEVFDRVVRARLQLLEKLPFFGYLLLRLRPRVAKKEDYYFTPTASVTRLGTLTVNHEFAKTLTDAQFAGLLCHEVLHPALNCFQRQQGRSATYMTPNGPISVWNCFPAGTTLSGPWIPIEEARNETFMFGMTGPIMATEDLHVRDYEGDLLEVKGMGLLPIQATEEHPFMSLRRDRSGNPPKGDQLILEETKASDLTTNHYLAVPRIQGDLDISVVNLEKYILAGRHGEGDLAHNTRLKELPINEETSWLIGYYVANGSLGKTYVQFHSHVNRTDISAKIQRIGESFGYHVSDDPLKDGRKGRVTAIQSTILSRFLMDECGKGAGQKRIPDLILRNSNETVLRAFLKGYMEGDGSKGKHDSFSCSTVSKMLAMQLQLAWARLGQFVRISVRAQRDREIRGVFIKGGKSIYSLNANIGKPLAARGGVEKPSRNIRWICTDAYIAVPVDKVVKTPFSGKVYNIATSDHTYTVHNALVHNCAHDHAINLIIDEMINVGGSPNRRIELPPNPCMDKRFAGMSAEEIYAILIEEAKQNNSYHRMPGTGADVQNDEPTNPPGQGDQDENGGNNSGNQEGGGERSISDRQRQADEDWKSALVAAARKQEKTRGNLPLGLQKIVNELVDPKVPWSEVLSQWLGEYGRMQDFSYRKLSRRSEVLGQILPGIVKYGVDEVCVLWDTSGSMNGQETEILSEVQGILDDMSFSLRIIVCDCRVHSDVKEIKDALEAIPHIKGGGGSDFNPAFDILRDEDYTGVVVAFTDGYIGVPVEKPLTIREVLWVLKEGEPDPTQGRWGMVLRVKDGSGYME